jgi:hypothetical protein
MDNQNNTVWLKNGYVWLILGGPFLVVIASFFTYYLAATRPDVVIDNYYQKGIEINKMMNEARDPMAPATQARNHAQTGIKPKSH